MSKFVCFCLIILFNSNLMSQGKYNNIYGTWVSAKITYKDGRELPPENLLKYVTIKYTFKFPDTFNPSWVYYQTGIDCSFLINDNYLIIKSIQGGTINILRIESLKDTLILLQNGSNGFDDPNGIKYFFIPENVYQNSISLQAENIHSIKSGDTVYNECPKIYANFKGNSFQNYIYQRIEYKDKETKSKSRRNSYFKASFIVSKNGVADSLKILEGINDDYNKIVIQAFKKSKKDWIPGTYRGKNVPVYMLLEFRFLKGIKGFAEELEYSQKAKEAYDAKEYNVALFYFDKALNVNSTDKDDLYRRGFCKMFLGNKAGACEDWNAFKLLGGLNADKVLNLYCK